MTSEGRTMCILHHLAIEGSDYIPNSQALAELLSIITTVQP